MNQKTLDPEILNLNLFYKKNFYEKASNFLSTVKNYSDQLQTSIEYQKTLVSNDVITSQADFFNKLNNKLDSFDSQFAAFWVKKYNTSLNQVKTELAMSGGNKKYFQILSDSIGTLARIENYYDDSTSLVSDINSSNKLSPLRYGSSLFNKVHPSSLMLHCEMSKKLNIVFNKNINNIQSSIASNTTAHGDNLIPDIAHFERIQSIIDKLNQKIQSSFGSVYKLIEFYCFFNPQSSINNLQFAPNINITVDIEGNPINQDLLFNQLQEVKSELTTMKVLGVEKQ